MEIEKKVLSPADVAKILDCNRKTVYDDLKANRIPHVMVGNLYKIPVAAFNKWMECQNNC